MNRKMRSYGTTVFAMALGVGVAANCSAAPKKLASNAPSCKASAPAALTAQPARWLGNCFNGMADGLGVMRAGSAEPYQFFLGEMHAGSPVRGMLKEADGWEMAAHFDEARVVKSPRSWDPNDSHAIFVLAARAARATAAHFSSLGNRSSAVFYERLAQEVIKGEPE